jgi:protein SCO1/2
VRRSGTVTVAALLAIAAAGCGGGTSTAPSADTGPAVVETTPAAAARAPAGRDFSGGTVSPVKPAPELGLRAPNGKLVRIADYKGKVVLVTFLYVNCPDICPLIVDNLVRVKERLGPDGKRVSIVAVSVDPNGDTPAAVQAFLKTHRAQGKVDYLLGSSDQLEAAWARWGIGARANPDNPELIEHSGVIWGLDRKGRRTTFYPASGFDAADIEGDVRLLLAE